MLEAGCWLEQLAFWTTDRQPRALAINNGIAWPLMAMTRLGWRGPGYAVELLLTDSELSFLGACAQRFRLPGSDWLGPTVRLAAPLGALWEPPARPRTGPPTPLARLRHPDQGSAGVPNWPGTGPGQAGEPESDARCAGPLRGRPSPLPRPGARPRRPRSRYSRASRNPRLSGQGCPGVGLRSGREQRFDHHRLHLPDARRPVQGRPATHVPGVHVAPRLQQRGDRPAAAARCSAISPRSSLLDCRLWRAIRLRLVLPQGGSVSHARSWANREALPACDT